MAATMQNSVHHENQAAAQLQADSHWHSLSAYFMDAKTVPEPSESDNAKMRNKLLVKGPSPRLCLCCFTAP
jgi:hypothetical protein